MRVCVCVGGSAAGCTPSPQSCQPPLPNTPHTHASLGGSMQRARQPAAGGGGRWQPLLHPSPDSAGRCRGTHREAKPKHCRRCLSQAQLFSFHRHSKHCPFKTCLHSPIRQPPPRPADLSPPLGPRGSTRAAAAQQLPDGRPAQQLLRVAAAPRPRRHGQQQLPPRCLHPSTCRRLVHLLICRHELRRPDDCERRLLLVLHSGAEVKQPCCLEAAAHTLRCCSSSGRAGHQGEKARLRQSVRPPPPRAGAGWQPLSRCAAHELADRRPCASHDAPPCVARAP